MSEKAHQPRLISESEEEYKLTQEEQVLRDEYRECLRQYLQDPEFRQIPGFPIGEDDAILDLSDPPYYTSCPNPFHQEIIEAWRQEQTQIIKELGLSDVGYHREPFAADVSEGKNNPIYNTHTYHTKVPHPAIMRYILHYTNPGDIIFDGFCGTGMTGVAAQFCGDRSEVEKLGYYVDEKGWVYEKPRDEVPISALGTRNAILNDLSPAATFIAYNYSNPVSVDVFEREAQRILDKVEAECGWMYETWHPHCDDPERVKAKINYTIWSDVFVCPECGIESPFWDIAVNPDTGYRKGKKEPLECAHCSLSMPLAEWERAWISEYDAENKSVRKIAKRVPVRINYSHGNNRLDKKLDQEDQELIRKIDQVKNPYWYPIDRMPEGDESRRNDDIGITHVNHFYTKRNLYSWSLLLDCIKKVAPNLIGRLRFWMQSVTLGHSLLNRHLAASYSQVNRYLKGTLYIAPFISEVSPWYALTGKIKALKALGNTRSGTTLIETCSATSDHIPDQIADYIFTDPPFGSNISYSDLNFIWETWTGVKTNNTSEAIVSNAQMKALSDYQALMYRAFDQYYRILKPGRWMTVEFHNSSNAVWNSIQEALLRAGFVVADVRTLDKKQMSMQQMTTTGAVKQDLIISAYKPHTDFEEQFSTQAGSVEGAWAFIRQHMAQLPVVVTKNGDLEALSERQDFLLFDRMVAFHIQRSAMVPLSAAQFYAGLDERFPKRDGMYFLPEQVPEYDKARLVAVNVSQITFLIGDEKTAIQWLRQQLDPQLRGEPQTYSDIMPNFLRQLHQVKHEALPELSDLLGQNFLQDEAGRWYVPDPSKASDLEKVRQRALLREFQSYLEGAKPLKQFRTEAIRAGFADAYQRRNFQTILKVSHRLPERVLQEDPALLMYYDSANLREE